MVTSVSVARSRRRGVPVQWASSALSCYKGQMVIGGVTMPRSQNRQAQANSRGDHGWVAAELRLTMTTARSRPTAEVFMARRPDNRVTG